MQSDKSLEPVWQALTLTIVTSLFAAALICIGFATEPKPVVAQVSIGQHH